MPELCDLHGEESDGHRLEHLMAERPYNVLFLRTGFWISGSILNHSTPAGSARSLFSS